MSDYIPGRVSVIVPAYNHAAYVRECIDSALSQTYPDVEVVVVDDGSTDGTYEILQTYGDRIKLIRQENAGTQAARNAAIRASTGEFLALLDSDDVWLPEKLARQMRVFEEHPETALVYAHAAVVDPQGQLVFGEQVYVLDVDDPARVYETLLQGCHIPALTAVFRRDCLNGVGYFDEAFVGAGDWDMWLKIAERWPVRGLGDTLALYRRHVANTSKSLEASRQVVAERAVILKRYLQDEARRRVPQAISDRARANAELIAARCGALERNSHDVSASVLAATIVDRSLTQDSHWLEHQVLALSQVAPDMTWRARQCFAQDVYRQLAAAGIAKRAGRRAVLGELTFAEALACYHNGDRLALAAPLARALLYHPGYLANGGFLSMAATLLLGKWSKKSLASWLRRTNRHLQLQRGSGNGEASKA